MNTVTRNITHAPTNIRLDYQIIADIIKPNTKVLDLGCGGGELLTLLIEYKSIEGTGVEIDENAIYRCIEKGITVSQSNINSGMDDFSDKQFDYVILNESLQEVLNPQSVILEALRVGKRVIVGIPNFCHLRARLQIFFFGHVPVTKELPYEWYNTPNLRFLSLKDFKNFCKRSHITICEEHSLGLTKQIPFLQNLFAHFGIFVLKK